MIGTKLSIQNNNTKSNNPISTLDGVKMKIDADHRRIATGSFVDRLWDYSGSGNDLGNDFAGFRPVVSSGALNGYDTLVFDGLTSLMFSTGAVFNTSVTPPYFITIVFKSLSHTVAEWIFANGGGAGGLDVAQLVVSGDIVQVSGVVGNAINLAVGTWGIVTMTFDGTSSYIRINKGSKVTSGLTNVTPGYLILGAAPGLTSFTHMEFREMSIVEKIPTVEEENAIIDSLNAKYDIF